jgi:DNA-binding CsgD family transcriptional regulator
MADNADGYDVPTIFITGHADVQTAVAAMKEGGMDLLQKPFEESALLETVARGVARGSEQRAYRNELAAVWRCLEGVTPREAEVCALVASGRLNKQIAALIGTTEKTVKVHRARVMRKLGIRSVAELVRVVDRVLGARPDRLVFDADHRALPRPRALTSMTSALGAASQQRTEPQPGYLTAARGVYREAATAAECYF